MLGYYLFEFFGSDDQYCGKISNFQNIKMLIISNNAVNISNKCTVNEFTVRRRDYRLGLAE